MSEEAAERGAGVKSAIRVLDVLEFFARAPEPASLTRICAALAMPKSSAHALMETLRQQGYVYWLGRQHGYFPTRRWRDLGEAITRHDPILATMAGTLRAISEASGETAILAKREETDVLYLDVVEPERTLRFSAYAGQIKPIHSAASGRALLGLIDSDERTRLLNGLKLQAFSKHTVTDTERLKKLIAQGEKKGYHVVTGEYQPETMSVAVGFRLGGECYALVVGAPTQRIKDKADEIGRLLMEQARVSAR